MMKESMITTILSVLCGLLLIGAIVGICLQDRTAPEISLKGKNTLVCTVGDSVDVLLKDMTAMDDVDGDVTDTIRVSNIYVTGEGKAVVTYVAKDLSNNIGKLKREIRYKEKEIAAGPEAGIETVVDSEGLAMPATTGTTTTTDTTAAAGTTTAAAR